MPVYSMTGYASASAGAASGPDAGSFTVGAVSVELRSVNGRFLDLGFRLPDHLRALEPALRELLGAAFRRGKIELRMSTQREGDVGWPQPAADQLNRLLLLEDSVRSWLPRAAGLSVHEALQWCRGNAPAERPNEAVLEAVR